MRLPQISFFFYFLSLLSIPALSAEQQPNILLIYVDDMGYGDLGCYGGTDIETPHMDRLADEGIRFTDAHVTCSVCGPSRVGLMTGMYQQRLGCYWNRDLWHQMGWRMDENIELIPQSLKKVGYTTGLIGKWNVSIDADPYFDETHDVMLWKGQYYVDESGYYKGVNTGDFRPEKHGWFTDTDGENLTDRLTRKAVKFIRTHQEEPFFLYLAYNAPHTPLNADIKYKEKYAHLSPEPYQIYAGMVDTLDVNIGKLLEVLDELDLEENTLIVFASDNGPAKGAKYLVDWPADWQEGLLGSTGILNGKKASFYEGGHRIPFMVRWKGTIEGQQTFDGITSVMDIYPTLLELTGAKLPVNQPVDGRSFVASAIQGKVNDHREDHYWMTHNGAAIRDGDWKLVLTGKNRVELYDLKSDVAESHDLSATYPERTKALIDKLVEWSADFPEPVSDNEKLNLEMYLNR